MPEPKNYKAKFIDQISEKSKWALEEFGDQTGTLIIQADNHILFITEEGNFRTSELQADPCWRDNDLIFVTWNSTYVFEILEEVAVGA
jgi:hypothetical protein